MIGDHRQQIGRVQTHPDRVERLAARRTQPYRHPHDPMLPPAAVVLMFAFCLHIVAACIRTANPSPGASGRSWIS